MSDEDERFAYAIGFFDESLDETEKCVNRIQFEEVATHEARVWAYGADAVSAMVAAGESYVERYSLPCNRYGVDGLLVEFDDNGSVADMREQPARFLRQTVFFLDGPNGDGECYEVGRGNL